MNGNQHDKKSFTPMTHVGDKGNECRSTIYDKLIESGTVDCVANESSETFEDEAGS